MQGTHIQPDVLLSKERIHVFCLFGLMLLCRCYLFLNLIFLKILPHFLFALMGFTASHSLPPGHTPPFRQEKYYPGLMAICLALRYYLGLDGLFLGWKQRLFLPCGGGDAFHAQPSSRMLAPSHSLANRCVLAGAGTSSL